jgi:hypothetical protein
MNTQMKTKFTGIALAVAAAGLMGCETSGPSSTNTSAASNTTDLVHCYGVNACNGHNDCKTASNACKGQGACKGLGFVALPSKACADVGGERRDDWTGSISTADLSHCYGTNVCKGHNDCKTAGNACKGQAACKGQGFVAAPAKACADIGGKVGA